MVDTGSQITLISHSFFKSTEFNDHTLLKPDYDFIKGVSKNTLPILAKIILPFEIDNKIFWILVHVVKGLNQTVIIGVGFMVMHNVPLHLKSKTIKIDDSINYIPIEIKSHFSKTAQKIVVPPKHGMIIPVKILNYNSIKLYIEKTVKTLPLNSYLLQKQSRVFKINAACLKFAILRRMK